MDSGCVFLDNLIANENAIVNIIENAVEQELDNLTSLTEEAICIIVSPRKNWRLVKKYLEELVNHFSVNFREKQCF